MAALDGSDHVMPVTSIRPRCAFAALNTTVEQVTCFLWLEVKLFANFSQKLPFLAERDDLLFQCVTLRITHGYIWPVFLIHNFTLAINRDG